MFYPLSFCFIIAIPHIISTISVGVVLGLTGYMKKSSQE